MGSHRLARIALALTAAAVAGAVIPGSAGATSPTPPHIVAKPNNVMVNTKISLTGTGFPAHAKLTIKECSRTGWVVVAQHPCDSANTISVITDAHGRFTHPFVAQLCPRVSPVVGPITQETCYIGNPQPRGVDTITLVGAARIIVTYP